MKWRDIFGSADERKEDRKESRAGVITAIVVILISFGVAWGSARYTTEPSTVLMIALAIAFLGFLFLLQEVFGLLLTHTFGVKPLLILMVPMFLAIAAYKFYSWAFAS